MQTGDYLSEYGVYPEVPFRDMSNENLNTDDIDTLIVHVFGHILHYAHPDIYDTPDILYVNQDGSVYVCADSEVLEYVDGVWTLKDGTPILESVLVGRIWEGTRCSASMYYALSCSCKVTLSIGLHYYAQFAEEFEVQGEEYDEQ